MVHTPDPRVHHGPYGRDPRYGEVQQKVGLIPSFFSILLILSGLALLSYPVVASVTIVNFTTGAYTGEFFNGTGITSWVCPAGVTDIQYLVLAGGGGGGGVRSASFDNAAGGGGAGGIRTGIYNVSPGAYYSFTVGAGGAGAPAGYYTGSDGGTSSIDSLTAIGGGGGARDYTNTAPSGGSGGGGGADNVAGTDKGLGGSGTSGQGFAGGDGSGPGAPFRGGGGGGGSVVGATGDASGNGGDGYSSAITGTAIVYAGGGGGGMYSGASGTAGAGGSGGGGGGGKGDHGTAAKDGTGGGGGGAGSQTLDRAGGDGGDGIIIIRYIPSSSDTKPPQSITGLSNGSVSCDQIPWSWTNPPDADYYQLVTWKNNVLFENLTNVTSAITWTGLTEGTNYTISSRTKDLSGNINSTFVNKSSVTSYCAAVPTPTPTPAPTPGSKYSFYPDQPGNICDYLGKWGFDCT